MDASKRPLRIPSEFSRYAEEKGIFELYERMAGELLIEKPVDPLAFLHEFLGRIRDEGKYLLLITTRLLLCCAVIYLCISQGY